jgi:arsenate reductase-like glutaredoxin family protein
MNKRVADAIRQFTEDKRKSDRIAARMENNRKLIKRYVLFKGKTVQLEETTCSLVRRAAYTFDIGKLIKQLAPKAYKQFISHKIEFDVSAFKRVCRERGIDYRIFESVGITVYKLDDKKLTSMISKGEIDLSQLIGCYTLEENPTVSITVK